MFSHSDGWDDPRERMFSDLFDKQTAELEAEQQKIEAQLITLTRRLTSINEELEPLQAEKEQVRLHMAELVQDIPGSVINIAGFGRYSFGGATLITSYNRDGLDALITELLNTDDETNTAIAKRIAALRKTTAKKSFFSFNPQRPFKFVE